MVLLGPNLMDTAVAEAVTRWFPAAFFTFVAGFYTLRIVWLHASRQVRHVERRDEAGRMCPAHVTFRVLRAAIWIAVVARAAYPPVDTFLGFLPALANTTLMLTGNILLVLSFLWVLNAHMAMRNEWQSGIVSGRNGTLITGGLFAWSRNPIFLGILAGQFGFFLAVPSLFSAFCLAAGVWAIGLRTRKEEAHLARAHGSAYRDYCEITPRWLRLPFSKPATPQVRPGPGAG